MADNIEDNSRDSMYNDGQYDEPMSLAEHQMLVYSARRIVRKARKFRMAQKALQIKAQRSKKELNEPLKPEKAKDNQKIEFVESTSSPQVSPKKVFTVKKLEAKAPPIIALNIAKLRSTSQIIAPKSLLQKSIDPIGTPERASPRNLSASLTKMLTPSGQPVKLTIGDRKIIVQPTKAPLALKNLKLHIVKTKKGEKVIEELDDEISQNLNPESFPKAIVYPEVPKEKPPMKIQSIASAKSPFTFSHVFEEAATKIFTDKHKHEIFKPSEKKRARKQNLVTRQCEEEFLTEKTAVTAADDDMDEQFIPIVANEQNQEKSIAEPPAVPVAEVETPDLSSSSFPPNPDETIKKIIKFTDYKRAEPEDEPQFEAVPKNESPAVDRPEDNDFDMPLRPEINIQLMEILAHYRVLARSIMLKKKVSPFSFDSTESEYIRSYRSLKK